jgi:NAD+ kinase
MNRQFNTISVTGKREDDKVAEFLRLLASHLVMRDRRVLVDASVGASFDDLPVEVAEHPRLIHGADLMIAIGGDGTMLYATRLVAAAGVPLLGINRGRLGFLADVGIEDMLASVDEILGGRYAEDERVMLEAEIQTANGPRTGTALNDVVLQKRDTGRMIDFETWIDGTFVNAHGGDGLIVATPTGSTAYALSGGGPILHPGLDAFVMVPICPHTLSDRPLVVRGDSELEVRVLEREDTAAEVTCDGHLLGELTPAGRLLIRKSADTVTLVHPVNHDYFRMLRSKLHWGRGTRNSGPRDGG